MKNHKIKKISLIMLLIVFILTIFSSCNHMSQREKLDKNYSNLDDLNLIAPYDMSVIDNYMIREFSTDYHIAIDFFSYGGVDSIPFLAMQDGIILDVREVIMENQLGTDNWCYQVFMALNTKYVLQMGFETFDYTEATRLKQKNSILVKKGQLVKQGDVIGHLIVGNPDASHVHFNIYTGWPQKSQFIKPEPFFTQEALDIIDSRLESKLKQGNLIT